MRKKQKSKPKKKDRLEVLLEHMDGKIGLIAEQHGGIRRDIDEIKKTLNVHTDMIAHLTVTVEMIKREQETIKGDISIIKSGLKKKVDYDEFTVLERRV